MMEPDVSIVICTRDRAAQLPRALDALLAMRGSTRWEAIILDNCSSDRTADVIAEYAGRDPRLRAARETQPGLGAARDTAWRLARGSLISFTDDDCYVAPDYADQVAAAFRTRPELDFVGGRILLHNPEDARITIDEREEQTVLPVKAFIMTGVLQGANMSFRREVLTALDGYDRRMGAGTPFPCEDIDVIARASWRGFQGGFDPRPTVSHDHGRKPADVPALRGSYDRGRAAYFARFLAREDSSAAYRAGVEAHLSQTSLADAVRKIRLYLAHGNRFVARQGEGGRLRFNLAMARITARTLLKRVNRKARNAGAQ